MTSSNNVLSNCYNNSSANRNNNGFRVAQDNIQLVFRSVLQKMDNYGFMSANVYCQRSVIPVCTRILTYIYTAPRERLATSLALNNDLKK